jgi:phage gp45-like
MITIGTVRGSEITKNKDSDENARILQVELTNAEDLQSIEQVSQSGEDSNPQPGSRVIVVDLGPSYRVAVATDDGIEPTVAEGEKELYAYDSSLAKQAYIKILVDGSIELNGDTDTAVAFADLKVAFDQFKSDFDALVSTYNTHIHTTTATISSGSTGVIAPTASTGTPTTADIDPAEVPTVKVP